MAYKTMGRRVQSTVLEIISEAADMARFVVSVILAALVVSCIAAPGERVRRHYEGGLGGYGGGAGGGGGFGGGGYGNRGQGIGGIPLSLGGSQSFSKSSASASSQSGGGAILG